MLKLFKFLDKYFLCNNAKNNGGPSFPQFVAVFRMKHIFQAIHNWEYSMGQKKSKQPTTNSHISITNTFTLFG